MVSGHRPRGLCESHAAAGFRARVRFNVPARANSNSRVASLATRPARVGARPARSSNEVVAEARREGNRPCPGAYEAAARRSSAARIRRARLRPSRRRPPVAQVALTEHSRRPSSLQLRPADVPRCPNRSHSPSDSVTESRVGRDSPRLTSSGIAEVGRAGCASRKEDCRREIRRRHPAHGFQTIDNVAAERRPRQPRIRFHQTVVGQHGYRQGGLQVGEAPVAEEASEPRPRKDTVNLKGA